MSAAERADARRQRLAAEQRRIWAEIRELGLAGGAEARELRRAAAKLWRRETALFEAAHPRFAEKRAGDAVIFLEGRAA
jgi:hypothetical protein